VAAKKTDSEENKVLLFTSRYYKLSIEFTGLRLAEKKFYDILEFLNSGLKECIFLVAAGPKINIPSFLTRLPSLRYHNTKE
jgi:hypothetical protein